ncbi:alpha/beta hydrolase [Rhodococcus globerulus]|uniref:alpha/beta hydrolase n=1 Tax=Rhodococcus globerulus TaxID=33008 RepID=UPI003018F548
MNDTHEQTYPPVPLDPEIEKGLANVNHIPLFTTITVDQIDQMPTWDGGPAFRATAAERGIEIDDRTISIAGQPDLPIALIRRSGITEPAPTIFYIHGGGMISGNRFVSIDVLTDLVCKHDLVVASIDYRLAPQHPDPVPVEDCYAGLTWLAENAVELGVDRDRLMVVGISAGGGLAAGVTLLNRDRGGPALAGCALLSPMLDDRDNTISSIQHERAALWDRGSNRTGWTALLGDRRGTDNVTPYAAPARAEDLSGLPPTFLDCGSAEVFRDETVEYASRIWAAGGSAELCIWSGGFHGFEMISEAAVSIAAVAARENWIRRTLGLIPDEIR